MVFVPLVPLAAAAPVFVPIVPLAGVEPGVGAGRGMFAAPPAFSAGKLALSVFNGGTVGQLDSALAALAANGAWAQDANGAFRLYILNGGFVNDGFKAAFPNGFANQIALTLVGR